MSCKTDRSVLFRETKLMHLRDKIIHESLKLFSLKGYLNTSIEDILERANSSKGGLYNHFRSKDELFVAVLSQARRIWRQKVLEGLDRIDDPITRVKKLLEHYADQYLKDEENIPGGCVFVTLSVELDDQRPDFAGEISEGFYRFLAMIKRFLDEAKASGRLNEPVDTDAVSRMLFAAMLGASVLYGIDKSGKTLDKCIASLTAYLDSLTT
ncbi:MAG: TetR/AcrR family transcriptional regulator [Deltaproteobacteria bacterium]|nr:TetR/AcrR family transcriptional regulator [Deltaproteobacteria bacterium]